MDTGTQRIEEAGADGCDLGLLVSLSRSGWSIVPLQPRKKQPLDHFPLAEYFAKPAPPAQVAEWIAEAEGWNWGLTLGEVSGGIAALDIDSSEGELWVDEEGGPGVTAGYATGRGKQFLYKVSPQISSLRWIRLHPDVELRGNRHYSVIPPSVHPSGTSYRWIRHPAPPDPGTPLAGVAAKMSIWPLGPLPPWLAQLVTDRAKRRSAYEVTGS
jgi:hypothetical protein